MHAFGAEAELGERTKALVTINEHQMPYEGSLLAECLTLLHSFEMVALCRLKMLQTWIDDFHHRCPLTCSPLSFLTQRRPAASLSTQREWLKITETILADRHFCLDFFRLLLQD